MEWIAVSTNTTKAAKETTSRPTKNKNLIGTFVKGRLFIHTLKAGLKIHWRQNAESRICLVELKFYGIGVL